MSNPTLSANNFKIKKGSAPSLMEIFIYVRAKHGILLGVIEVNQLWLICMTHTDKS